LRGLGTSLLCFLWIFRILNFSLFFFPHETAQFPPSVSPLRVAHFVAFRQNLFDVSVHRKPPTNPIFIAFGKRHAIFFLTSHRPLNLLVLWFLPPPRFFAQAFLNLYPLTLVILPPEFFFRWTSEVFSTGTPYFSVILPRTSPFSGQLSPPFPPPVVKVISLLLLIDVFSPFPCCFSLEPVLTQFSFRLVVFPFPLTSVFERCTTLYVHYCTIDSALSLSAIFQAFPFEPDSLTCLPFL